MLSRAEEEHDKQRKIYFEIRFIYLYLSIYILQDRDDDGAQPVKTVPGRYGRLHPRQKDGCGRDPQGRGPHVDLLPVHDQRRPPENPDRDADHHLQEDLRQPGHAVEVSSGLSGVNES